MSIFIYIRILDKIEINRICLVTSNSHHIIANFNPLALEIFHCSFGRTFIQVVFNVVLKRRNKIFIPVTGNDGQFVDFLHI